MQIIHVAFVEDMYGTIQSVVFICAVVVFTMLKPQVGSNIVRAKPRRENVFLGNMKKKRIPAVFVRTFFVIQVKEN